MCSLSNDKNQMMHHVIMFYWLVLLVEILGRYFPGESCGSILPRWKLQRFLIMIVLMMLVRNLQPSWHLHRSTHLTTFHRPLKPSVVNSCDAKTRFIEDKSPQWLWWCAPAKCHPCRLRGCYYSGLEVVLWRLACGSWIMCGGNLLNSPVAQCQWNWKPSFIR